MRRPIPRRANGQPTVEYVSWNRMRFRCLSPKAHNYQWYGMRGIEICERWNNDFFAFLSDMGMKPSPRHTLDRIDNDGNYEPSNCRWALPQMQTRNSRKAHVLKVGSVARCLAEWSDITGVKAPTIRYRLKHGATPEEAIAQSFQRR